MSLRAGVIATLAALCTGCVPMVQHGPWVRPGASGTVSVSGLVAIDNGGLGALPSIDASFRYGFADSTQNGTAIGVQLPILAVTFLESDLDPPRAIFELLTVDGYLSGPQFGELDTAIGSLVSNFHFMPYIQFGKRGDDNAGWYVTQALLLVNESDTWFWMPSFSVARKEGASSTMHVTLSGGVGNEGGFLAAITFIFEFFRRQAR